jgi:hypothetical protein
MTIKAWSHSRLGVFEACPQRAKLAYVDRIPEPPRPLPPGKSEHANDRGSRIHDAGEMYVKGNIELVPELRAFAAEFKALRELYRKGKVSTEGEWGYDRDWNPVAWADPKVWLRMKLDAMVRMSKTHAVVIDYKTGKKFGNEIKHGEQGQLYQLGTFLRYPELQVIDVEFWYTDQDDITHMTYRREQGLRFYKNFDDRGHKVTSASDYPAKPNIYSCKWCPYNTEEHCPKGVR